MKALFLGVLAVLLMVGVAYGDGAVNYYSGSSSAWGSWNGNVVGDGVVIYGTDQQQTQTYQFNQQFNQGGSTGTISGSGGTSNQVFQDMKGSIVRSWSSITVESQSGQ